MNDLLRTPSSLALVWLTTRVLRLHPVSRHDGPLSVRRAYSADELPPLGWRIGRAVRGQLVPVARPAGGRGRMSTTQTDVVVVGAGPAGAATAILLAEHGLDVVVLDRAKPAAAEDLRRVPESRGGVACSIASACSRRWTSPVPRRCHGMRITAPDGTAVVGHYRDIGDWRPYRQHAMGVARATLDGALVERVRALPRRPSRARACRRRAASRMTWSGVSRFDRPRRAQSTICARALVVGADGRASVVAATAGVPAARTRYAAWPWSPT